MFRYYDYANILGLAIISISLSVMFGWFFDISILKSLHYDWVTMKLSTSISFLMTGIAILLTNDVRNKNSQIARMILPAPFTVILFFMLTLGISSVFNFSSGVENLFVYEENAIRSVQPGMPSLGTVINFLLMATVGLLTMLTSRKKKISFILASFVLGISVLALAGYVLENPSLYYEIENISTAMALHTSIAFLLAALSLIFILSSDVQKNYKIWRFSIRQKIFFLTLSSMLPVLLLAIFLTFQEGLLGVTIAMGITLSVNIVIISLSISRSISSPLSKLDSAVSKITSGDFTSSFNLRTGDEMESLGNSFNKMKKSVKTSLDQKESLLLEHKKMDKLKNEFVSMISHELKSPMTPIKGHCDLLLSENYNDNLNDSQKKSILAIQRNALSLENLIQQLIDIKKLELRSVVYKKTRFNIHELLSSLIVDFSVFPKANSKIMLGLSDTSNVDFKSDPEKIRQIFVNLIVNALDFLPDSDGRIEIGAKTEADGMLFFVKDNGKGISKNIQTSIFDKFFQSDTSARRKHGGMGLGLFICKGFAEGLGGKIWVESEENMGSTFYFAIPN